ncbi:MAG TPA: N-acetyl-gamma-glutamyl-phosphate reductase [Thermoanaerobaculia bacterium]|nr:N-acetyl-gamma-glutamyl-phosphate reductase [Thermoanaerobaculia bacterium]
MTRQRVAIVGATGYAGAELTAILAHHPCVDLVSLSSGTTSSVPRLSELHSSLSDDDGPVVEPFDLARILAAAPQTVFLATPNELSAEIAPQLLDAGCSVIDLSGAFRLRDAQLYPRWYGFEHPRPALLEQAVYGLTEWCNGELRGARLIANPGCYPTAILLALRPLSYLIDREQTLVCDAKSGVSGAGKRAELAYSFSELAGNFKAYGVGQHRHEPELRERLHIGERTPLVFVPHLLPAVRGILATLHITFMKTMTEQEITNLYREAYGDAPFVHVRPPGQLPELKHVVGTAKAEIGFVLLNGGRRAVVVSVIDNLLKGAASQAVQNFNRLHGFDEKEGLAA